MRHTIKLDNILFIDIETVGIASSFEDLDSRYQDLWVAKHNSLRKYNQFLSENPKETYLEKAGIYAEFGKVVCISIGYLKMNDNTIKIRTKSICDHDEVTVLAEFKNILDRYFNNPNTDVICGHNIREFDIPYLCRRMVINGIRFPKLLDISDKKPWQVGHLLDTLQMWKFGDYKNYTSLNLLSHIMEIPTPKDDIDGSMVNSVYYEENDLERIANYCEKDIITVAKILLKWYGHNHEMLEQEKA